MCGIWTFIPNRRQAAALQGGVQLRKTLILLSIAILLPLTVSAQQLSRDQIIEALERDGCVTLDQKKIKICKYDYVWQGRKVEGVTIRPLAKAKYLGLLLLPGRVAATSFITLGMIFAGQGFACLSLAEPGFGKSEGKPDFMGPILSTHSLQASRVQAGGVC